jgi:hypothetical protein
MKLSRIVIEDFRQFTGRVVIDGLHPGLNIFTGPNEAGKTSIATAVRTVFLEKHRSGTLKHLVPWQASSGQPRIEVEFSTGQQRYLLRKSFVTRARCELIRDGQHRLEGEEAEEALCALLRFSRPARGSAVPEHCGIPGLLWVTQGQAQDVDGPVTHAATYLRDALTQLSGATVEAGEDVLISAVKQELNALLTERTRKPTGALAAIDEELHAALEQQRQLRGQQALYEDEVDRLVRLQAEYDEMSRRKPWEALERKAADAQGKVAALRAAKAALAQSEMAQAAAQEQSKLLREHVQNAGKELEALERLAAEQVKAQHDARQATAESQGLGAALDAAAAAMELAQQRLQLALAAQQAHDLHAQTELQQADVDRFEKELANARNVGAQIRMLEERVNKSEIDEKKLRRLRALETELSNLQAKMDVAGTRIEYRLDAGKQLSLNGQPLQGSGQLRLEGKSVLRIPDIGEVSITLGASNITDLSAEYGEKKSEQAALLLALGAATSAEAELRFEEHRAHKQELENQRRVLRIYAPDGIDALESAVGTARARVEGTLARLRDMPDSTATMPLQQAKEEAADAVARYSALQQRRQEAFGNCSRLEARAASLLEQLETKRRLIESDEWRQRSNKHQADLADALAAERSHALQRESAKARLDELGAEINEGDVERYGTSARLQRDAHAAQRLELTRVSARLEELGASGIGERLADAAAAVEQLTRRKQELALRADALALLSDLLIEERDKAVRRLQAPLLDRLGHYLKKIFPQSELALDDSLSPATLSRNGWAAELRQLSFGTQEQLGILSRLAYADLLHEAKVPTLVMLDDAVVHTDAARRDRIKRALLDAVERHQILVFTCHPEAWDDLGIVPRSIQSLRVAASHTC